MQAFWNLAAAPIQARALELALNAGLFDFLHWPMTAAAAARRLDMEPVAVEAWLDLLWSMGLLTRAASLDSGHTDYRSSGLARRHFMAGAPDNLSQAWLYRARSLAESAGQMAALLRASPAQADAALGQAVLGRSALGRAAPSSSAYSAGWAEAAQVQIGQEQRAITVPALLRWLDSGPVLPARGRFLDLGGGAGEVAIALARRLTGWRGAVADLPATAAVAGENIRRAGLADKVATLGCDLDEDDIEGGYDLIWCGSVLHFLDDPRAALDKMYGALRPGGLLVLAHGEVATDAALAARVLPFYTPMRMRGKYLPCAGELAVALKAAGFQAVRCLGTIAFPMAPVTVYAGERS